MGSGPRRAPTWTHAAQRADEIAGPAMGSFMNADRDRDYRATRDIAAVVLLALAVLSRKQIRCRNRSLVRAMPPFFPTHPF